MRSPSAALSGALVLLSMGAAGCGVTLSGGGGGFAHGGGVHAVEEAVRVSAGIEGAEENRRLAVEVAGEAGFGQRLDAPATTRRYGLMLGVRYHPEALSRGRWGAFWSLGASFESLSADGYRDQLGALAHAGVGGTYQLYFQRSERGLWAGAMLEAVGGFFATPAATTTAERMSPALPTALYGGLRLSVLLEGWFLISR